MLVLLDRDGVINVDTPTGVVELEKFVLIPRSVDAIAMLTQAGFRIAVCTNQSSIGKGLLTPDMLGIIHGFMHRAVHAAGGQIDRVYFASESSDVPFKRRKPSPEMLLEAMAEFHADPARTPFVGDMITDMEAACAAGCPRILTRTGKGGALEAAGIPAAVAPVTVVDNLYAAAELICKEYR